MTALASYLVENLSTSGISTIHTARSCSDASLPVKVWMLSLYHSPPSMSANRLLPVPWAPISVSTLSNLQPGAMPRATQPVMNLRVTARV